MWVKVLSVLTIGCALLCVHLPEAPAGELQVVHSVPFPFGPEGGAVSDLAWDGQHLWAATFDFASSFRLKELAPTDGSVVQSLTIDPANYHGLTWDGTHLWHTVTQVMGVTPVDTLPDYIQRRERDGSFIGSLEVPFSPNAMNQGAAWDGSHLWLSEVNSQMIYRIDPADGSLVDSFLSPGPDPRGLAWDGASLWCVDGDEDLVYQLDSAGAVLGSWSTPGDDPWGLAFDGEHLWLSDNATNQIYRVEVPEPGTLLLLTAAATIFAAVRLR